MGYRRSVVCGPLTRDDGAAVMNDIGYCRFAS